MHHIHFAHGVFIYPDGGGTKFLLNHSTVLPDYTVSFQKTPILIVSAVSLIVCVVLTRNGAVFTVLAVSSCAMTLAVSRHLVTDEDGVRSQVSPCGGQCGTGTGFDQNTCFSLFSTIPLRAINLCSCLHLSFIYFA